MLDFAAFNGNRWYKGDYCIVRGDFDIGIIDGFVSVETGICAIVKYKDGTQQTASLSRLIYIGH